MTNIRQITPIMHVADVAPAVGFFTELLGFTAYIHAPRYAYVERDGAGVRIQSHEDPAEIGVPHRGMAYYIDVTDVDALHAELAPKFATLPSGQVYGPLDQNYGQRELMIRAPDGNLVVFGQRIHNE